MYVITWSEQTKCMVVEDIEDVRSEVENLVRTGEADSFGGIVVHHSTSQYIPRPTIEFIETGV